MIEPEPRRLLIAGDWHGNTGWARTVIEHAHRNDCDTIIQCGDFGYWTDTPNTTRYLSSLQADLEHYDMRLYWVDGNHEDHDRIDHAWRTMQYTSGHKRIIYLPRGYRWQWWGQTWMAVGGAVSVDKEHRRKGKSWWPQEELTEADIEYCCRPGQVDIIISHDCPKGVDIPGIGPNTKSGVRGTWPEHILHQAEQHRAKLRQIWNTTGATLLYHGHYHIPHETWFGPGRVVGLDCDGSLMRDHIRILDAP